MTIYLITVRKAGAPMIHKSGSDEEAACEIAKHLLKFRGPADGLMAIKSDSPLATFSLIKDDIVCSVDVTKQNLKTWRHDVANIQMAIDGFQQARERAEQMLDQALSELDEAYIGSSGFAGFTPSDDISIYGALEEMGANELDYTFQRALREMYQFHAMQRVAA